MAQTLVYTRTHTRTNEQIVQMVPGVMIRPANLIQSSLLLSMFFLFEMGNETRGGGASNVDVDQKGNQKRTIRSSKKTVFEIEKTRKKEEEKYRMMMTCQSLFIIIIHIII